MGGREESRKEVSNPTKYGTFLRAKLSVFVLHMSLQVCVCVCVSGFTPALWHPGFVCCVCVFVCHETEKEREGGSEGLW